MKKILFYTAIILMLFACNQTPNKITENATHGDIKIDVDESFKLLSEAEIMTFMAFYKYAKITPMYKPEYDVFDDFLKDSVRTIMTAKELTQNEIDYLKSKTFFPKSTLIAKDALAFIVNNENMDSLMKINNLKQIFLGEITDWNQINKNNKNGVIQVVFDNIKSANARYMLERLKMTEFKSNCFVANSNEEVINYVEKNKNAIGVISVNWVSESTDSLSNNFLKRVQVVALTSELDPEGRQYYKPYQAYIANESYPFIREVYMITRETFSGLGSGLIQFIAGEKGQRIVLKSGLVPATMPIRIVEMKNN